MKGLFKLAVEYVCCFTAAYFLLLLYNINYLQLKTYPQSISTCLLGYFFTYISSDYKRAGCVSPWFQRLRIWKALARYFPGRIHLQSPLDPLQQYIFASFPHGTCTVHHILTMTDGCNMLTDIYPSPRADLAATILFFIPILREVLLLLGCVDAGGSTAHYNMKRNKSLLIFVGGEKEQLLTKAHEHKVFLRERKGFIKLALQYGAHLVPSYCFGENETYYISSLFLDARKWLQRHFQLGIPFCFGAYGTLFPLRVPLTVAMGAPIVVEKKEKVTQEDIDLLHTLFIERLESLFEGTKVQYGVPPELKLEIL